MRAQLSRLEHCADNAGVRGSNPLARTRLLCRRGGIGRRARLRIQYLCVWVRVPPPAPILREQMSRLKQMCGQPTQGCNMQIWWNRQTRQLEGLMSASSCRFKSCYLYQRGVVDTLIYPLVPIRQLGVRQSHSIDCDSWKDNRRFRCVVVRSIDLDISSKPIQQ